jgi:putative phosphoesterase
MDKIERAMRLIIAERVSHVIHAGDYVAPFSLKLILRDLGGIEFTGVFGNNDGEKAGLTKLASSRIHKAPHTFTVDGKRFFLTHDIERHDLNELKKTNDVIIFGHSHKPLVEQRNGVAVINPGACCGILAKFPSIAFLTLPEMKAEIVRL